MPTKSSIQMDSRQYSMHDQNMDIEENILKSFPWIRRPIYLCYFIKI